MIAKRDIAKARTPSDLERRYNFGQSFAEVMGLAQDAQKAAEIAQNAAEEAGKAAEDIDKKLTSEEIFNILTMNGTLQGLYRGEDGNIYINATYIKSGEFLADLIKAGVIKSKDGKSVVIDLDNGLVDLVGNLTTQTNEDRRFAKVYPGGFRAEGDWGSVHATSIIYPGYIELNGYNYSNIVLQPDLYEDGQAYLSIYSNGKALGAYVTADRSFISGLTAPINSSDAVNKEYVDNQIAALKAQLGL